MSVAAVKLDPRLRGDDNLSGITKSFLVDKTPFEVFAAITNVPAWWTGEVTGKSIRVGDEFTYRYKDLHTSTQRVMEVVPEKRVVWLVTDANLSFAGNPRMGRHTRDLRHRAQGQPDRAALHARGTHSHLRLL